jgi:hypothetical protein
VILGIDKCREAGESKTPVHTERGFVLWHGDISKPKPLSCLIEQAHKYHGVWTHYPYTDEAAAYFGNHDKEYDLYANFRDPRDIIVSVSHALMGTNQKEWWWNYRHGDKRLSDMPFEKRIDCLIYDLYDELHRHDKWRTSGICKLMYYSENVNHEIAKICLSHKAKGVVGRYKNEMTEKQIERSTAIYGELIEAWQ